LAEGQLLHGSSQEEAGGGAAEEEEDEEEEDSEEALAEEDYRRYSLRKRNVVERCCCDSFHRLVAFQIACVAPHAAPCDASCSGIRLPTFRLNTCLPDKHELCVLCRYSPKPGEEGSGLARSKRSRDEDAEDDEDGAPAVDDDDDDDDDEVKTSATHCCACLAAHVPSKQRQVNFGCHRQPFFHSRDASVAATHTI
jgi:hypothetical protein